jgi:protein-tyrosine phosphatase
MHGRIDVHGHYLPQLDDGSRSIEESVEMARCMASAGYTHLTCSPHVWPEHKHTPRFIVDRVNDLQGALDERGVAIKLIPGGELNLVDLDVFSLPDDQIISYGMAGKYVLFDFWAGELPDDYWERIARIKKTGAIPVQAHPERIACFQYHPLLLDELAEHGVLLQCNLQCLSDLAGVRTRDCAEQWLSDRRYFMLASDAHRIDTMGVRLRGLQTAMEILGLDEVDRLTKTNPAKVIGLVA